MNPILDTLQYFHSTEALFGVEHFRVWATWKDPVDPETKVQKDMDFDNFDDAWAEIRLIETTKYYTKYLNAKKED